MEKTKWQLLKDTFLDWLCFKFHIHEYTLIYTVDVYPRFGSKTSLAIGSKYIYSCTKCKKIKVEKDF